MLDWLFVLETDYPDTGHSPEHQYEHTVTKIESAESCERLLLATLQDLSDYPCSYTNRGSGAPVGATGTCFQVGSGDDYWGVRAARQKGVVFSATVRAHDPVRFDDYRIDTSKLHFRTRAPGHSPEPQSLCLNGYNWEPCR